MLEEMIAAEGERMLSMCVMCQITGANTPCCVCLSDIFLQLIKALLQQYPLQDFFMTTNAQELYYMVTTFKKMKG